MELANTIWKQINISTKMACGVRKPVGDGHTLRFQVGGNASRYVAVTLNSMDTYDVEYFRVKRTDYSKISLESSKGVYVDMLNATIYHMVNK